MPALRLLTAIVSAAVLAVAAADRPPAGHQRPPAPKTAMTKPATAARSNPRLSDAQLEADIRARFAKSKINADKFQVHVQGGVATVEGRTDVIQHKGVATRLCRSAGAAAVNNHIQISDAARQKAAGNLAEGRRRAQIKRSDARDARR